MRLWRSEGCNWVGERLEPWIDGEVPAPDATRVADHLAECAACRGEMTRARRVATGLRALPRLDSPVEVMEGVAARVQRARRLRRARRWIAAAAVVIAAAGLGLYRQHQGQRARVEEATVAARYALAVVGRASRTAGRQVSERFAVRPVAAVVRRPVVGAPEDGAGGAGARRVPAQVDERNGRTS